jgi:hypothetical protein
MAACGGSGFESGTAMLTSIKPAPMSASAVSFVGADGSGKMVLGWTIDFFEQGAGADCQSQDVHVVASVGIFSNTVDDGTHKKAMLATGDIVIVATSPPTVQGNAAATMGATGINSIVGTVTITEFHLRPDLSADRINGTINAGGTDSTGTAQSITGTFMAPVCE